MGLYIHRQTRIRKVNKPCVLERGLNRVVGLLITERIVVHALSTVLLFLLNANSRVREYKGGMDILQYPLHPVKPT